ncbi:MAG TPA: hypothetical protein DIU15_15245, partial [Deltaproteobacteria bacterium]|nr:hypothetical protein [Deltaproteobacteria bacterium]
MTRPHALLSVLLMSSLVVLVTCVEVEEGAEPGDCFDRADNDQDGQFDCDDAGCDAVSPCPGSGYVPGTLEGGVPCDAGDEAFVRRLVPQLWG